MEKELIKKVEDRIELFNQVKGMYKDFLDWKKKNYTKTLEDFSFEYEKLFLSARAIRSRFKWYSTLKILKIKPDNIDLTIGEEVFNEVLAKEKTVKPEEYLTLKEDEERVELAKELMKKVSNLTRSEARRICREAMNEEFGLDSMIYNDAFSGSIVLKGSFTKEDINRIKKMSKRNSIEADLNIIKI